MENELLQWINKALLQLNLVESMEQTKGFTRLGYTKEEQAAQRQFRLIAQSLGLHTYQDVAGNQWAVWQVDDHLGTIATGSHLDTVYNGGGYDGVAGVVAALAAVKLLKERRFKPTKNIAIVVFACEESARFGISTIGSKAICGLLEKDHVASIQDANGISVEEAVNNCGLNWRNIEEAELSTHSLEQFIELHIEQGSRLEKAQKEIGIVRAIAQPTRLFITCNGMTNHTGTTPMNERQDALVPIAQLISYIEKIALEINERQTTPLMATVSTIKASPNAMNMIPEEVIVGIDIRSTSAKLKKEIVSAVKKFIEKVEAERSVTMHLKTIVDDEPIQLDQAIQTTFTNLCKELGLSSMIVDSGAGHDVMNMAKRWPSGLLFIPCREGISHHPSEYADCHDLLKGATLIAAFLEKAATITS
ncbi:Zn-dependent hydrolase [Sporosarcina sp. USHLN248]|uniref:Zn-dependent hydrolase n=1 Tax=Sporosarcina sp. USHLN248 TaxID=3081300 RepID=UPI00301B445C